MPAACGHAYDPWLAADINVLWKVYNKKQNEKLVDVNLSLLDSGHNLVAVSVEEHLEAAAQPFKIGMFAFFYENERLISGEQSRQRPSSPHTAGACSPSSLKLTRLKTLEALCSEKRPWLSLRWCVRACMQCGVFVVDAFGPAQARVASSTPIRITESGQKLRIDLSALTLQPALSAESAMLRFFISKGTYLSAVVLYAYPNGVRM